MNKIKFRYFIKNLCPSSFINLLIFSSNNYGAIDKRKISYNRNDKRGATNNPFLRSDDIIYVGKIGISIARQIITELTSPFTGLCSTYRLFTD